MTVKELIEFLQQAEPNADVYVATLDFQVFREPDAELDTDGDVIL